MDVTPPGNKAHRKRAIFHMDRQRVLASFTDIAHTIRPMNGASATTCSHQPFHPRIYSVLQIPRTGLSCSGCEAGENVVWLSVTLQWM